MQTTKTHTTTKQTKQKAQTRHEHRKTTAKSKTTKIQTHTRMSSLLGFLQRLFLPDGEGALIQETTLCLFNATP